MAHSASSTHQNGGHTDTAADGAITGDHSPRSDKEIVDQTQTEAAGDGGVTHSFGFWMVFVSLSLASFLAALDVIVITTALPTITREIGGQDKYVWISNCYVITSTALQPLGQLSNIFALSGLGGGATKVGMLIVGRSIQGIGSGGIMMLLDLIVCDLVPLRERNKYIGIVMSTSGVSAALGP